MAPTASGHHYSHPDPGEEVCITGIAGYFPKSDSIAEFSNNLFNKVDLITDIEEWKMRDEIPLKAGKINKHNKFDARFFNMDYKDAHHTEPMSRLLLERTYEAIIDAGVNPSELRNTKTGVYMALCFVDTERELMCDRMQINDHGIAGCTRSNIPVRIAEWLGVTGPAYAIDTACSSSLYVLDHAFKAIRDGQCDSAVVCTANLTVCYEVQQQFQRLGLVSPDNKCKSFDESANGYVRAEAVVVCFLQKAKDSRRVHAQLIYVKTNCDGYKEQSILFPSTDTQAQLLSDFYEECAVSPDTLEFLECHCTGTAAGDPEEVMAVDRVICSRRAKPLLIGSVKSNMGHSEPAAGLCGMAKVCIAYNVGYIPPNINLTKPRKEIHALIEGRVQVVTDKVPWNRGLVAVSSFGFGGANAHCLLKNIARGKVNNGLPSDKLPRLVCVSGRTQSAVAKILRDLENKSVDVEEIRLWHAIHERDIRGHQYRGYTLLCSEYGRTTSIVQEIKKTSTMTNKICLLYSDVDKHLLSKIFEFMEIPTYAETIQRCDKILQAKDFNLMKNFKEYVPMEGNGVEFILSIANQIAFTNVFKKCGVKLDYIMGKGAGELCCAYADDCLSDEQTILAAYDMIVDENLNKPASHTRLEYSDAVSKFLKIKVPSQVRSKRWISQEDSNNHGLSITKPKLNVIVIEIAPHGLKTSLLNGTDVPLIQNKSAIIERFYQSWGTLYMSGLNPHLAHLYPSIQLPVSQGTPLLSHLVEWDHREDWFVDLPFHKSLDSIERRITISLQNDDMEYLKEHVISDRIIFPGTGYLVLVWETLALTKSTTCNNLSVVFEDVRLERATILTDKGNTEFTVTLHKVTGEFEITENETTVVTGRVFAKQNIGKSFLERPKESSDGKVLKLNTKEFYRELRLKGYGHRGLFQGILECTIPSSLNTMETRVIWLNNWTVFLDNVLQIHILSKSGRELFLPTRIKKLAIDTNLHFANIHKDSVSYVETYSDFAAKYIRTPGIEVKDISFNPTTKLRIPSPVLETYKYMPYFEKSKAKLEDILRIYLQIMFENKLTYIFNIIEIFDEDYRSCYPEPITQKMEELMNAVPGIETILTILSAIPLQMPAHVTVENLNKLGNKSGSLVIGFNLLKDINSLQKCQSYITDDGFIISREQNQPETEVDGFDIISSHEVETEHIVLIRKNNILETNKYIRVELTDKEFSWVDEVKKEIGGTKIILYAQNEYCNGIIGLVNCLQKEPDRGFVCAFFITDPKAPLFDPTLDFYKKQIDKGLMINIFQDGQWGTYRHFLIKDIDALKPVPHAYNNIEIYGDLSTMKWFEGPLADVDKNKIVHVYYSALNFLDVVVATGRLYMDNILKKLKNGLGTEIAGRSVNGSRLISILRKGFSNKVYDAYDFTLPIPDEWTFEEGATIIIAYSTVYLGLIIMGKMRPGERVLIHAGTGGVGQAAISVALHHGCEVFTTVGSTEKREILKKLFPQLKDSNIGCSRDTSFEQMIREETKGEGVDIVLNSLADDMLLASIRCLAYRGRFLEIGKYDISRNTLIDTDFHEQEVSYHAVMLDQFDIFSKQLKQRILEVVVEGIASGAVRPLTSCIFEKDHIESAFRYMAVGKHIGKVVMKIRDEEENRITKPTPFYMNAVPRFILNPQNVFMIVGGLGGFGLELANWLVGKQAKKLLLVSSRGITSDYQAYRIRTWKALNVNVKVTNLDVTSEAGCKEILKLAKSMGTVEGIFNLAAMLKDVLFQRQTRDSFKLGYGPKATAALLLDKLSRSMCPRLKYFVMFSSLTSGRGNAGQTNYGYANSVMEKICEQRKQQNLPALAIQWGLIGDVGLLENIINKDVAIKGVSLQSVESCLQTLDKLMTQHEPVVSSYIVEQKKKSKVNKKSLVETVAKIKGIRDLKAISHQATLTELGMDSMMAVEIKQALETGYRIFLTPQEIRKLTFARLTELSKEPTELTTKIPKTETKTNLQLRIFVKNIGDEESATKPFIYLPSLLPGVKEVDDHVETLFLVPGLEGCATTFEKLCKNLQIKTCVLQLGVYNSSETLDQVIDRIFEIISVKILPGAPFKLLGYSFGTYVVLGLAAQLEKRGHRGTIFCLDGAPKFLQQIVTSSFKEDKELENITISNMFEVIGVEGRVEDYTEEDFTSRIDRILEKHYKIPNKYSKKFIKAMALSVRDRYKIAKGFKKDTFAVIESPVILIRAKEKVLPFVKDDYYLDECTNGGVTVHYVLSDHGSLPDDINCAKILNKYYTEQ